jgi:5-formyltetrahydrofolate cyclo-ligase
MNRQEKTDATRKRMLRRMMQARRDQLVDRQARSERICAQLAVLPIYHMVQRIHCYLPIRSEVDTRPCIMHALHHGKQVAVPLVTADGCMQHSWITSLDPDGFTPGQFGTLHPKALYPAFPGEFDLILAPVLAFDREGFRLGYGKGYYDRLLAETAAPAIGLAFADQELAVIPREAHDRRLRFVVTETFVIDLLTDF